MPRDRLRSFALEEVPKLWLLAIFAQQKLEDCVTQRDGHDY